MRDLGLRGMGPGMGPDQGKPVREGRREAGEQRRSHCEYLLLKRKATNLLRGWRPSRILTLSGGLRPRATFRGGNRALSNLRGKPCEPCGRKKGRGEPVCASNRTVGVVEMEGAIEQSRKNPRTRIKVDWDLLVTGESPASQGGGMTPARSAPPGDMGVLNRAAAIFMA